MVSSSTAMPGHAAHSTKSYTETYCYTITNIDITKLLSTDIAVARIEERPMTERVQPSGPPADRDDAPDPDRPVVPDGDEHDEQPDGRPGGDDDRL